MTRPRTDHNDLARFLEHTLSEEEHARALAQLSASDEDADVLADAAYMLRELEAEDGVVVAASVDEPVVEDDGDTGTDAKVLPFRPPSTQRARPRRIPAQWLALAAVLAGVLLVMPSALSRLRSPYPGNPEQIASVLTHADAGLPADSLLRWSRTRGPDETSEDDARAARLGALLLDLEVAVKGRQVGRTQDLAGDIKVTMAGVTFGESLATPYDSIAARAGAPPEELAGLLQEGYGNVADLVDRNYFAAGAWLEAAKVAVATRDTAFFHARATRRALDGIARVTPDEAQEALTGIRAASRGDGALDWKKLGESLDALGRALWY